MELGKLRLMLTLVTVGATLASVAYAFASGAYGSTAGVATGASPVAGAVYLAYVYGRYASSVPYYL